MARSTGSGTILSIGGQGPLGSESGWVTVGQVENIGEFGNAFQQVTAQTLGESQVFKGKGARDSGTLTIAALLDGEDAGQIAIAAAAADSSSLPYNIRIELNDAITPTTGTPTTYTFQALVSSTQSVPGANEFNRRNITVDITTAVTEVAAT